MSCLPLALAIDRLLAIGLVGGVAMGVPSIRNAILQNPVAVEGGAATGDGAGAVVAEGGDEAPKNV